VRLPNIFPILKPVSPPVLKWHDGPAPKDAADEYTRAQIISDAAVRATLEGEGVMQRAHEIADERGVSLDPARGIE
jgi:hypothetical protein